MSAPQIHPSALVEAGVEIGAGTAVWDNVHIRAGAQIGEDCIIGEKTYIAYDVQVGNRVKINAFVYICAGVTIEDGVMVSAGTIFTNDRFPRATDPDLSRLLPSEPEADMPRATVRRGATIGARVVIGPGIDIGEFAMVGMGAVVTRSVPAFGLAVGSPATVTAFVCRCGTPLHRWDGEQPPETGEWECMSCERRYRARAHRVEELPEVNATL